MMHQGVSPKGYEATGIDKAPRDRDNLGRPLSPGSDSKVFAPMGVEDEENEENTGKVKLKKDKMLKPWVTADAKRDDKGAYVILSIRDFIIYLIFLSLLLTIAYGPQDNAYNYYESVFSDLITKSKFETTLEYGISNTKVNTTFTDVRSIRQLWDFISEVLVKVIYMDAKRNTILLDNVFVGTPTIRQIRVKKDTCITAPMFRDLFRTCYNRYSEENEDKEPIGEGISSPWKYTPASIAQQGWTRGIRNNYPGGGYTMNFTMDASFTKNWLKELERNHWIGPGTRAVIIDFALYTPNANLFLIAKLLAEVLPEGGVKTRQSFMTIKFLRYNVPYDYFVMSCEILFVAFTIYFTFEEGYEIWLLRKKYLSNWWNVLDLTIIGLSYSQCFAGFRHITITSKHKHEIFSQIGTSNHASYYAIVGANEEFILVCSFLVFVAWLKLFKFSSLFRSVILLAAATKRVKWELLTVSFTLLIIFAGFSILGFCLFGGHVDQYEDILHSYVSVVTMFVGRLNYINELLYVHGTLAKLFIGAYCVLVVGIFMSTYLALIAYAYQKTHLVYEDVGDQQYVGDLVYSLYINILSFCRKSVLVKNYKLKDARIRNQDDYDAFVAVLRRYGWPLKELNLFLRFYKLHRGEQMNFDQLTEIYDDFWIRNQLFIEVQAHNEISEQLDKISKTIEFCEHTIVDVMSRTDVLADKAVKPRPR